LHKETIVFGVQYHYGNYTNDKKRGRLALDDTGAWPFFLVMGCDSQTILDSDRYPKFD
jgi:hypothetical protein